MANLRNLSTKRQRSLRMIVITGISVLLALSFAPSKAVSNKSCSTPKVIYYPNGDDQIVSLKGSSAPADAQVECAVGGVVDVPKFSRDGFTLTGWTEAPDDASAVDNPMVLSANSETWTVSAQVTRAFAQWQPVQYSVTYNYDGGESAATDTTSTYGSVIYAGATISNDVYSFSTPTKTGFRFVGWSFNNNTYVPGSKIDCPAANVAFTAVWTTS
jgi:hypothetical protein